MDDRYVLARSDTQAAPSVVSGDYHIVQPKGMLEFYRDLMDLYGYRLDTAGALDGGRKLWALARTGMAGAADEAASSAALWNRNCHISSRPVSVISITINMVFS